VRALETSDEKRRSNMGLASSPASCGLRLQSVLVDVYYVANDSDIVAADDPSKNSKQTSTLSVARIYGPITQAFIASPRAPVP